MGALAPEAGSDGMCRAADNTGVAGLTPPEANFLCTFLHQCGTRFRRAAPAAAGDVLQTAHATVAAGQAGFPTVALDSALRSDARGGLSGYDAALEASACPGCGVLDTLYTAGVAAGDSPFAGKPIAWRWSAPAQTADRERGPVALFTFPLEALAIRGSASAGTSGDDLETLASVLAAWFRARGILNADTPGVK